MYSLCLPILSCTQGYLSAIKQMVSDESSRTLDLAVSYWSNGVIDETKLLQFLKTEGCNIRIICDLGSPACRYEPIETLLEHKVKVKRLDRLHAKVWITSSAVLIGSANMSRAALRLNSPSNSNQEAGIFSTSSDLIAQAQTWFEVLWNSEECKEIDKIAMNKKKEIHNNTTKEEPRIVFFVDPSPGYRTFESFVGEKAGAAYRASLEQLGFGYPTGTRYMRVDFSTIQNNRNFIDGFITALNTLVRDSENKSLGFTGPDESAVPQSLIDIIDRRDGIEVYLELLKAIKQFIKNHEGGILRLREPWETPKNGIISYSTRLANSTAKSDSGSVGIALIEPSRISFGRDVPGKWGQRVSTDDSET